MPKTTHKPSLGHDVSNLAAFGWEWYSPAARGGRYQLVGMRGVEGGRVRLYVEAPDHKWIALSTAYPEANFNGTKADFMRVVTEFIDAGETS